MTRRLACARGGALLASLVVLLLASAASAREVRVGMAPRLPSKATVTGELPSATRMRITIALKPRNPAALAAYANAVSNPASASYHRYLSVAQFAQRFGPTTKEIRAVRRSLRDQGLDPGAASANGLAIPVSATAGKLERVLATSFRRVSVPGSGARFANVRAPRLDAGIASEVEGIVGLNDLSVPTPQAVPRVRSSGHRGHTAQVATGGPQPCSTAVTEAAAQPTTYTADQIASAYGFSGLYADDDEGAGQTIAVYELEGNIPSDITAYEQCYGTSASVSYVQVDGGPGRLNLRNEDGLETELDVESIVGLAPKANVLVYQGPNSDSGAYDTYNSIISQDKAQVITTSWGDCESDEGTSDADEEYDLFLEADVQGETVLASAGDTGSEDCYGDNTRDKEQAVDDPASQPYVTGVGGTSLTLGPPQTEDVWNDSYGAGGGGVSSFWGMPSYQSGAASSLHVISSESSGTECGASSGYCREVPDVSADADPNTGVLVYYDGNGNSDDTNAWTGIGGTSAATPLWASLIALANASSSCTGTQVGFANPALYRAAGSAYASDFYDVTAGDNDFTGTLDGLYAAGSGYDLASGLGTPIASGLGGQLCSQTVHITNPGTRTSTVGTSVSTKVTANDTTGTTLTYEATNLPPGLTIDSATGVISGHPRTAGTYKVTVAAVDSDGASANASFTWTIEAATVFVTGPANQIGRVKRAAHLQLTATDDNGGALTYTAAGLPSGLSLNRTTGLISGTPRASGKSTVTVTATDGASGATAIFTWTVAGPVRVSGASLSDVSAGKPRLALTVTAGAHEPALTQVVLALPGGLSLGRTAKAIAITSTGLGRHRIPCKAKLAHARLTITLSEAATQFHVSISAPSLRATTGLVHQLASTTRKRKLNLVVRTVDASALAARLSVALKT